jgi:hypothetical protein
VGVKGHVIGKILATMQRGERAARLGPEQREMQIVDMEVQDVELAAGTMATTRRLCWSRSPYIFISPISHGHPSQVLEPD